MSGAVLLLLRLLGSLLGQLAYFLGLRRDVTLDNLHRAFPTMQSSKLRSIARRSFSNLGIVFAEMLYLRFARAKALRSGLTISNLDRINPILSSSKGAILLSGHIGNWEWLAIGCGLRVQRHLSVIIKNQRSSFIERFLGRMRTRFGNKMLNAGDVRAIFKALQGGAFLAILGDQTAGANDMRVTFFGRDVPTFEGTARLALRSGAPILFLQPVRRTRRGYECLFHLVESSDLVGATKENILTLTARHTTLLEQAIRQKPELWLWQHRRWKHAKSD
ncbi:MAG: lysophospholipid acyltransferase family protein [Bacteroidota bacterium]|nr:lysophospholipid acyltransferase family protein [Bacteroidota bacterium]MDP4232779.1 lysophospholipid acyltransferase family protein [Bacteroidota bacterium]MDP4242539.1 lysophospholipid acyltransferase family protein [Bacteroidota bacterium]MDP4288882.1 lysophospholipid acyltransferase family protein [Bacteroidota bacterium]